MTLFCRVSDENRVEILGLSNIKNEIVTFDGNLFKEIQTRAVHNTYAIYVDFSSSRIETKLSLLAGDFSRFIELNKWF